MAKGRKTAALAALGLGAAALSGMFDKKKKDDDSKDTTADASAGQAKDRLGAAGLDRGDKDTTGDMSAGMSKDKLENMRTSARKAPAKKAEAPVRSAPVRSNPAISPASVPKQTVDLRKDKSLEDELQGLSRLRENRGDMTETGSERIARKQEAGRDKMVNAYRSAYGFKKGGSVKSSASRRGDGIAQRGKTKGRMV